MKFRVGGTEVRLSFGVLPLFAFCIVARETRALLLSCAALSVHEISHAIAIGNLGGRIARISIYPFGAVITPEWFKGEQGDWIAAIAGPLGSFALSGMLAAFRTAGVGFAWTEELFRVSLLIGLLNLVPAYPLDGGRVCRALLLRTVSERRARTVLLIFTALVSLGLTAAGVYLILHGVPAWTLLAIPPFLLGSAFAERRMPDAGIVARVMERREALRSGTPQKAQTVVLCDTATVGDAILAIAQSRYTILRIRTATGFVELTESDALQAAARCGLKTPLKTAISRLTAGK